MAIYVSAKNTLNESISSILWKYLSKANAYLVEFRNHLEIGYVKNDPEVLDAILIRPNRAMYKNYVVDTLALVLYKDSQELKIIPSNVKQYDAEKYGLVKPATAIDMIDGELKSMRLNDKNEWKYLCSLLIKELKKAK
jgi:hypothetical protein